MRTLQVRLRGQAAHPDSLRGGLANVNALRAAACHGEGHGLIVLALVDGDARAGAQIEVLEEVEELGILFVHAQYFVQMSDFCLRKPDGTVLPAKLGHAPEKRDAVRAAAVAPKPLEQQVNDFM